MNTFPSRESFLGLARPAVRMPVVRELPSGSLDPYQLYQKVRTGRYGGLLESGKHGRYSYVFPEPERVWSSRGEEGGYIGESSVQGNPFQLLRDEFAGEAIIPNGRLLNFQGGAVGYLSYDIGRHIERLPSIAFDDLNLPDSLFLFVDRFFEFDHVENVLRIVVLPRLDERPFEVQYDAMIAELDRLEQICNDAPRPYYDVHSTDGQIAEAGASLTQDEFESIVRLAKDYIVAGDIFQVNLSVRFHHPLAVDPLFLYGELRQINPSPYMSYFDMDGVAIVSASPELLVSVRAGVVETRPIAGTRPRGASREEDLANAKELIENEKERAEHLMLVDLERNDIGRVASYGSVKVDEFMAIEEYSHVIHIVSHVRGELSEGLDMFDAIIACFPGGTITGAPKIRSMEIIEELEPVRRGLYTGSIGWLGYDGNATLNIAIRTILVRDEIAYVQAGAGIVADSDPVQEYHESARKAEAGLAAIRRTIEHAGTLMNSHYQNTTLS